MTDHLARPSAGPLRRLAALVYDLLLLVAISIAYWMAVVGIHALFFGTDHSGPVGGVPAQLGWPATLMLFYCVFWRRGGQTLGMRAWRLQLVSDSREEAGKSVPSWQQCLLRCLVAPLAIAAAGIGYWWCFIDSRGRSLHDRLSGTRVILVARD